ncbi:MAG TPA: hypothetical protein VG148_03235, partial [Pyrinomonadaceae bacterium]|nr:hypothetical protein [Pyrinomonadaceae bacterium]
MPTLLILCAAALIFASAATVLRREATPQTAAQQDYGRIPLAFEANRGQTAEAVNFLARGAGYTLFLKPDEAVFALSRQSAPPREDEQGEERQAGAPPSRAAETPAVLRMRLVGADAGAAAEGADELGGKVNYLVGDDPAKWRTGVPTFARVRYRGVYPGIDLVYYGNQRQLEYDFVVAPGRDPRAVKLDFEGADTVELDAGGDLLLRLGEELIRQPKPHVYQEAGGARPP